MTDTFVRVRSGRGREPRGPVHVLLTPADWITLCGENAAGYPRADDWSDDELCPECEARRENAR